MVGLAACDNARTLPGGGGSVLPTANQRTTTKAVHPSVVYGGAVTANEQAAALGRLDDAVRRLRSATTTGWQLRQDDTTGTGAELSGGVFSAPAGTTPLDAAKDLLRRFPDLFGLTDADQQIAFPDTIAVDTNNIATLRAVQQHRGVPVEGTNLLVVIRNAATSQGQRTGPEISYVKAHLVPGIAGDVTPQHDAAEAAKAALRAGATPTSPAQLVITTEGNAATLLWKLTADYRPPSGASPNVVPAGPVTAYVDATTGTLLQIVPAARLNFLPQQVGSGSDSGGSDGGSPDNAPPSAGLAFEQLRLPPQGTPITVTGVVPGGLEVTIQAEQLADGSIAFIDSSQPGADRTTGRGLNIVYDGSALRSDSELPGKVATQAADATPDSDTFAAAWAAKTVLDYYRTEMGRASWDGNAAPLVSTVHVPKRVLDCNAYFTSEGAQMVYAGPCSLQGKKAVDTFVDLSVVGHEITHGVTGTTSPWISATSGQGAALNEGNSDYFGVIIQNQVYGKAWTTQGVTMCVDQALSSYCNQFPDAPNGGRNVDSGAIFDDSEFVLREPDGLVDTLSDYGGAHDNSLVWTNALWQIRKAFASHDGGDLVHSADAARFDHIVYRAITTYFTNETDMPSAAAGVLQAAIDLQASPDELNVIQQQFIISELCLGCTTPAKTKQPVATSGLVEIRPQIVNGGVVYIRQSSQSTVGGLDTRADMVGLDKDAKPTTLTPNDEHTFGVSGAGDWLVETQYTGSREAWYQLHNLHTGSIERLGPYLPCAAPAVSETTVVWCSQDKSNYQLNTRLNSGGDVATLNVGSRPIQLGIDGKQVAYILQNGTVAAWSSDRSEPTPLMETPALPDDQLYRRMPGGIVVSGLRVAALLSRTRNEDPTSVVLFALDTGTRELLTDTAFPAGISMDGSHVVWAETVGQQQSGVAAFLRSPVEDTTLMVYSAETKSYTLAFAQRGQQGFPSIRGQRLAWQDSASGSDDIYTALLPPGL